jgi:hypothetical protein
VGCALVVIGLDVRLGNGVWIQDIIDPLGDIFPIVLTDWIATFHVVRSGLGTLLQECAESIHGMVQCAPLALGESCGALLTPRDPWTSPRGGRPGRCRVAEKPIPLVYLVDLCNGPFNDQ